jgi:CRP/FNR family transcriptional regulator, nitrogen oxide reductase regulator
MAGAQPWAPSAVAGTTGSNKSSRGFCRGVLPDRITALVQQSPLFSNISPIDCREILSSARKEVYAHRQKIYLEGDLVRHVVLLTSGCGKIVQVGQNGCQVILRLSGPGDVLGMVGFEAYTRHCSTAQSLGPSTGLLWEASAFEALSVRFPALRRNTAHILCKRLEELEERFREISTEKVAARLSHEILRLLNQVGRQVNGGVQINLSREELAQLIGTTLFTVSRLLSDWDEQGIVSAQRQSIIIKNFQALEDLSETD